MGVIVALILEIAMTTGINPLFVTSVAAVEIRYYSDISTWDDSETVRTNCQSLKKIISIPEMNTYWIVCVYRHAGYYGFVNGKPRESSLEYADRVMEQWHKLQGKNTPVIIIRQ